MKISVVNMIPRSLSGETNQDSEPNLAVNPTDTQQIVATAFTPNPSGGPLSPIFISSNGGQTWALNPIVPGAVAGVPTADITTKFGGWSNVLYGGILRGDSLNMNVLRTNNFASSTPMTVLVDRVNEDQPWVQATTTSGSVDRVYIGHNDFNTTPRTATVEQSLNAATAPEPAGFGPITIASRIPGGGQNAPSIRPTIHSSGMIYVGYFNWQTPVPDVVADVVVCRDDNWGQGKTPYQALIDPGDLLPGVRVAQGVLIPWANVSFLGQERVLSHLAIAVDPNNQESVFVAWTDYPNGEGPYTIHLRHSANAGITWSGDLRTVANGINPAIAVDAQGNAGFLYQTLTNGGSTWETHVEISSNLFATAPTLIVLAIVPSNTPVVTFLPYLGDYVYLTAVGTTFYGVFSANNTPDLSHFPNGVTYQRNHNFATRTLLNVDNTTPVSVSIDPFFFSVREETPLKIPDGALTVMDRPTSAQRPYAFITAVDGDLWVDWWSGSQWGWADQGKPAGANIGAPVGVTTLMDTPSSAQRPYVFVQGSDGHLWLNWWSGSKWSWVDQVQP